MKNNYLKSAFLTAFMSSFTFSLTACQTLFTNTAQPIIDTSIDKKLEANRLDSFSITGKIGVVNKDMNQSGSAFYGWAQDEDRFNIELQGALGIGYTLISYDGATATLTNGDLGTLTSDTPEELLVKATGWKAPISQLPYWISGSPAPSDDSQTLDNQSRLAIATNGNWTATFTYSDNAQLPNKIISRYQNDNDSSQLATNAAQENNSNSTSRSHNNKVVLTINHAK